MHNAAMGEASRRKLIGSKNTHNAHDWKKRDREIARARRMGRPVFTEEQQAEAERFFREPLPHDASDQARALWELVRKGGGEHGQEEKGQGLQVTPISQGSVAEW